MPIASLRDILDMLDLGRKVIASNFSCFFYIENTKIAKDKAHIPLEMGFALATQRE